MCEKNYCKINIVFNMFYYYFNFNLLKKIKFKYFLFAKDQYLSCQIFNFINFIREDSTLLYNHLILQLPYLHPNIQI
jgi:hypothetical protein